MDQLRTCKSCNVEKPLTEAHYPRRRMPSGNVCYRTSCKQCVNDQLRGKALERMRRLRAADGGAGARKAVTKWKRAHPVERVAHQEGHIRNRVPIEQRPRWGNRPAMQEFYRTARLLRDMGVDATVDHVIPLFGELVCGLHVLNNLNLLSKAENSAKGNAFDPNLWIEPTWAPPAR